MVQVSASGRTFVKTRYFFKAGDLPHNYHQVARPPACPPAASLLQLRNPPTAVYFRAQHSHTDMLIMPFYAQLDTSSDSHWHFFVSME